MNLREEKITSLLKELLSKFLSRVNFQKTILTVTRVELSKDLKRARVFISIYPLDKEGEILGILKKKEREAKQYVGSKTKMKFLPHFEFFIDKGEKNRQRIEELLNK